MKGFVIAPTDGCQWTGTFLLRGLIPAALRVTLLLSAVLLSTQCFAWSPMRSPVEDLSVEPPVQAPAALESKESVPAVLVLPKSTGLLGLGVKHASILLGGAWQARGPGRSTNGQVENIPGNNPVCGAINTLAPHPSNANILYVGAVNGGIWRTANATNANPDWAPLTDQSPSLSIGDLEFDPTDVTNQTLVAGIGQFSSFGEGGAATGLLRTIDGGNTWTQLGQTELMGLRVWAVAPRGATILVGTSSGLFRSTNGGASFQNISGLNGLNTGIVFELARDPSSNSRIYAAVGGASGGIFRTDNLGAIWTNVTDAAIAALVSGSTSNMQISVSAAAGNAAFLGIVNNGRLAGVFRSANQGGAWTAMDLPRTQEGPLAIGIHPGGQGRLHFSLLADNTNGNIVYVGGDRQPSNPGPNGAEGDMDDSFPNSIGANDYSGRLFRGDASVAPTGGVPSPQWTPLTHSGTASNSSPHADSRDMDFDANGNIVEGDDGGIYRRTSPRNAAGNWFHVFNALQVGEFHDIAYDDNFNVIVGGTQDTGTPYQTASGSLNYVELATADGGDVAVDDRSVPGQSTFYWSFQNLLRFRRRTCTGANICGGTTFIALNLVSGNPLQAQFVTPIQLNSQDATRLIIGGSNSVYESADQGNNITELNSPGVGSNGMIYGHPNNADLIAIGSGSQVFVRTTAGGNLNATAANPQIGFITDLAVDPASANGLFVCSTTGVARTTDGGANWTNITGNLADLSGNNIRAIAYIQGVTNDLLVVGAALGTFALAEPFCGCWFELGTGLPNAPVWDLDYDVADDLLIAGLFGRGAFALSGVAAIVGPADAAPVVDLEALGGDVAANCVFSAPYRALITDDCGVEVNSIVVRAVSLDGCSTVGTPTVNINVVSGTEIIVTGFVPVSALTCCPADVRVRVEARDECGEQSSESDDIEVFDRIAPQIAVKLNPKFLWPPNHKLVTIQAVVEVTDSCPITSFVLKSVTSNEPENARGDGNTAPDIVGAAIGTADTEFQLRSERQGIRDGRVYTIVYEATDGCGNKAESQVTVRVDHSQAGAAAASIGVQPDGQAVPTVTRLAGILPNPFQGSTVIALDLSTARDVQVSIFNLQGALVRSLAAGMQPAGRQLITWDGRDNAGHRLLPGVYLVRVAAGDVETMRRAILIQ